MPKTSSADQISEGEKYLSNIDPRLRRLIVRQAPIIRQPRTDYFMSLARSIIGQQVSMAAAAAIFDRFKAATDLKPGRVIELSDMDLRTIGLSHQKTLYLRDLARHFYENPSVFDHLATLDDETVIAELTTIKGIGVWTAQMFLMSTLVRLDVFAPDDIGLQRAMKQLYGWKELPAKAKLLETAKTWRPYRTIACWHLWRSLNNGGF